MLATGTTLGCGLSIALAFWTSEPQAAEAQVYRFAGGTVVVQPGPVAAPPVTARALPPAPQPMIRQASFTSAQPVPPLPDPMTVATPAESPVQPAVPSDGVQAYRKVYDAIPFSRAEYDANPGYRHDAAMEFLFGQLRPTVIHRGHTTVTVQQPDAGGDLWSPWVYYGRSGWYAPYPAPGYRVFRGW